MLLDLFLDAISFSAGLSERISGSIVAIAMLVAGLAFLGLAILMAVVAAERLVLSTLLFAGLFLALSAGSFWLMFRAAGEPRHRKRLG